MLLCFLVFLKGVAMLVPAEAFRISKACDTENSRYALGAVKLERKGDRSRAVATNGRIHTDMLDIIHGRKQL